MRLVGGGTCLGFNRGELDQVINELPDVVTTVPGCTNFVQMSIDTGTHPPIAQYL